MSDSWIFVLGLALMFVLGPVIWRRLRSEYWSRLRPSIETLAAAMALEEGLLGRLYGEAYEAYRHRTHRYLGPPKRAVGVPPKKSMQPTAFGGR